MSKVPRCKSCGEPILWVNTINLKSMPINYEVQFEGDTMFDPRKHTSHFATCPNADKHRNKK